MGGIINEFFKSLKPKEKIVVISSVAALGVVLIGVVLLIAFCSISKHTHQYDYKLDHIDGKFNLVGECKVEDCDEPNILISDVEAEVESAKAPTCTEKGETVYAYTYKGNTFKYTEQSDALGHFYNGKTFEAFVGEDGFVSYDEPGVKLFAGVEYTCSKTSKGGLNCDSCGQLASVDVYTPHIGEQKKLDLPDCVNATKVQMFCKFCAVALSEPTYSGSPLGHSYNYSLSGTQLSADCKRCDDAYTTSVTILSQSTKPATCASPEVTTYVVKASGGEEITFSQNGPDSTKTPHTLNGVLDDGSFSYDTPGVVTNGFIPCGQSGSAYYTCEVCNGLYRIDSLTMPKHEIYLDYANANIPSHESSGMIFIRCEREGCDWECPLFLPKVQEGENTSLILSQPTDTDPGRANCRYEIKVTEEATGDQYECVVEFSNVIYAPAKGHNYGGYIVTPGSVAGTWDVSAKCINDGCNGILVERGVVEVSQRVVAANCLHGMRTYYVGKTQDDRNIEFYIESGSNDADVHILGGVDYNSYKNPDNTFNYVDGVEFFGNTTIACGQVILSGHFKCEVCGGTVIIENIIMPHDYNIESHQDPTLTELGKIVLTCKSEECESIIVYYDLPTIKTEEGADKNAEIISDDETATVYKYTYYIENTGYTVSLNITINK